MEPHLFKLNFNLQVRYSPVLHTRMYLIYPRQVRANGVLLFLITKNRRKLENLRQILQPDIGIHRKHSQKQRTG